MLANFDPMPTLAVSDMQRAHDFYGGLLGFPVTSENPEGTLYSSGGGSFFVYQSSFAGTNKATAMSIQVPGDAFDAEVQELRDKGVTFQTFDAEGMTWDDGVAAFGDYKAVWFDDPDGNILNVETVPASM
ncbi:MAG TPA: VOC family protein [Propionibacteriaceae bacterium]|nr:VOC family protein [Propionibacteriaceae bacterium]